MYTTIKISEVLKGKLELMKMQTSETYEEVIEDLIEDRLSLNSDFIKEIEKRRGEAKRGKVTSLKDVRKELGLNV